MESYYESFKKVYYVLSFFLFEIIPFFILSILNLSLILMVKKAYKNSKLLQKCDTLINSNHLGPNDQETQKFITYIRRESNYFDKNALRRRENSKNLHCQRALSMRSKSIISNNLKAKIIKRYREQVKLSRALIAVIFIALVSEICSIITYDKITLVLIGQYFESYMKNGYEIQRLISNIIIMISHSVNFLLFCAFNSIYTRVLKFTYSFFFKKFVRKENRNFSALSQSFTNRFDSSKRYRGNI